jgi:peptidyl-prolyl cis-trans isomerase C
MSWGIRLAAALAFTAGLAWTEPVVLINGTPIDSATIDKYMKQYEGRVPADEYRQLRLEYVGETIRMHLKREFARTLTDIPVSEAEITASLDEIRREVGKDPQLNGLAFEEILAFQGITLAELRDRQRNNIRYVKYLTARVGEAECRRAYEAHPAWFDGTEVRARQVFFSIDGLDKAGVAAQRASADAVREQLCAVPPPPFEDASGAESATIRASGDLGYFPRLGRIPDELARPAFDLSVGEISPVIETPWGFHILKVLDRRQGPRGSYEACAASVRDYLIFITEQELIAGLMAKADIVFPAQTAPPAPGKPAPAPAPLPQP